MTMKALVYHGPEKISLDDVQEPKMKAPTDAIVKVTLSTICGSDIHIWHGGMKEVEYPKILGHEFVGEIVELGDEVKGFKVGDRVAVSCLAYCGECFFCKEGFYAHCTEPTCGCFGVHTPEGCQTEFVLLPYAQNCMYKIPESLTEEDVLFVGDILSTGYYGAERAKIEPGDTVAVIGSGPVGMCAMTTARLFGPSEIIAVDMNQGRLDAALKAGIADRALNPKDVDVAATIKELTEGRGADRTIEAVGAAPTLDLALNSVRSGGIVSTIGVYEKPFELHLEWMWYLNIYLSMGFVPMNRVPQLIKLIEKGKINTNFLITHRAPLNDILKGYDIFGSKKDNCLKWVVTPYER